MVGYCSYDEKMRWKPSVDTGNWVKLDLTLTGNWVHFMEPNNL